MHSYDLEGRTKVVLTIAAASFVLTGLFNEVLSAVDFTPPWWLSVPSFAGVYSALH